MSKKIFISYNHKDQPCAFQIRDRLVAAQWEVLIDAERMQSGENIDQFIMNCIRESDVTLSLISTNSLLSAWVAVETMATGLDERIRSRRFIPCYIDAQFFDRGFTAKAIDTIEGQLQEIDSLMTTALQKGWGMEDLQSERSRYLKLRANLPEIVGKLRSLLCINLAGEDFEAGMQKVLTDLGQPAATTATGKEPTVANAANDLQQKIETILDEGEKQRLLSLQTRLTQLQQLLSKYEEELDFETDPKRQMRYEREIANTKKSIRKVTDEIQPA